MLPDQDERIRRRAYEIWEREGRPDGREAEHWRMARDEIATEGTSAGDTQEVPATRIRSSAKPSETPAGAGTSPKIDPQNDPLGLTQVEAKPEPPRKRGANRATPKSKRQAGQPTGNGEVPNRDRSR